MHTAARVRAELNRRLTGSDLALVYAGVVAVLAVALTMMPARMANVMAVVIKATQLAANNRDGFMGYRRGLNENQNRNAGRFRFFPNAASLNLRVQVFCQSLRTCLAGTKPSLWRDVLADHRSAGPTDGIA